MSEQREQTMFRDGIVMRVSADCKIERKGCKEHGILYGFWKNRQRVYIITFFTVDLKCPSSHLASPSKNDYYTIIFPTTNLIVQVESKKYKISKSEYQIINPNEFNMAGGVSGQNEIKFFTVALTHNFYRQFFPNQYFAPVLGTSEFNTSPRKKTNFLIDNENLLRGQIILPLSQIDHALISDTLSKIMNWLIENHPSKIISPDKPIRDNRIDKAADFIVQNYYKRITLRNIADFCGLSRSQLVKLFRERTGKSPLEYLILFRLKTATEFLRDKHKTISKIAYDVGYNNEKSLRKAFLTYTKQLPSSFRLRE